MKRLRTGLIGEHIGRSRFRLALGIMCEMHGIELEFEAIDSAGRADFDFYATVDACRNAGWTGVNVTHPFKTQAAHWAGQAMVEDQRALGAANQLVFGPPVRALNTDFTGFVGAWRAQMERGPGRVAMAGAGGVARAIGPALARLGASQIAIWDRDLGRAQSLASLIGPVALAVAPDRAAETVLAADGLVNATPMGMREYPGSAFDPALLGPQSWAFDAVYTPGDTEFAIGARRAGLTVLGGFALFQFMAMASFHAYTGVLPNPVKVLPRLAELRPSREQAT